jgi:hypothetical protein
MKKLIVICLVLGFYSSHAQTWRLNGYAFYVFDDKVDNYATSSSYYSTVLKGGLVWGGSFEYMLQNAYGVEFKYLRQDTKAPTSYYDVGDKNADFKVGINWITLGFNRYQHFDNDKVEGYGGLDLGVAIIDANNPNTNNSRSATKFAWGLKLGVNIFASEKFGIKLQTSLMSAAQGVGGSLYFGTGGAGAGASTYSSMLQFGLGGGIVVPFGGHTTTPAHHQAPVQ